MIGIGRGNKGFVRWIAMSGLMLLLLVGVVGCTTEADAGADADGVAGITVGEPWIRAGLAGRPTAGYMVIANNGDMPDRLVEASVDVAEEAQIHESRMGDDGEMLMVHMEEGLEVPAGGELVLKPESYHIMLLGLRRDLEEGETIPVTLTFEVAGDVTVEAVVKPMDQMGDS